MKHTAILALTFATIIGLASSFVYATGERPAPDHRPQAGTIACRDAQIERMHSMVVNVSTDPFQRSYEASNEAVVTVLDTAADLQALCK